MLRRWRALADALRPARGSSSGETYVLDLDQLIPFYGSGEDELNLAFNFLFVHAELEADTAAHDRRGRRGEAAGGVVAGLHGLEPRRRPARDALGRRRPASARGPRCMMLLTLRGTPFLYYGDEIGLPDVPLDPANALDPVARRTGDPARNRDLCRTPMQWTAEPGAGFTTAGATPWLPFGDAAAYNVARSARTAARRCTSCAT